MIKRMKQMFIYADIFWGLFNHVLINVARSEDIANSKTIY